MPRLLPTIHIPVVLKENFKATACPYAIRNDTRLAERSTEILRREMGGGGEMEIEEEEEEEETAAATAAEEEEEEEEEEE
ncbi:hypothetical protein HZH68_016045 [Vespula germanica]|uniref:Uncharacterized protein n=1 Tax=Vespula germanica TaxID=30212 RepID=A0A834MQN8_VESGE|nr:hypothetical protein HZH68_016045 [Vespula germanica]